MQRQAISWNAILLGQALQSSHGYTVAANLLLHTSEDSMKSQGSAGHLSTEKFSAWCQQKSPMAFTALIPLALLWSLSFITGSHVLRVATLTMRSFLTALPCSLYSSLLGSNTLSHSCLRTLIPSTSWLNIIPQIHMARFLPSIFLLRYYQGLS